MYTYIYQTMGKKDERHQTNYTFLVTIKSSFVYYCQRELYL